VITRRAKFLRDYQNEAYAARYRASVERMRRAEESLPPPQAGEANRAPGEVELPLADAVARSLFKLMAYKDEYEVARLHMQTGFLDELKSEFDGDFSVQYHLAPPFLPAQRDARGRPRKRAFGQWIQTPLRLLARLKGLRGTAFDPFGYTAERRSERELIKWYETVIDTMLGRLDAARLPEFVAIAKAPMDIRGYGPVKDDAIDRTKAEVARLTARLTSASSDAGDGSGRRAALGG
jgi:indolepyruvate ferredoxin oxidoreductase